MSCRTVMVALATVSLLTAGCAQTVDGRAMRAQDSVPVVDETLTDSGLEDLLVSPEEAGEIIGVTGLEPMATRDISDTLNVNRNKLSEEDCRAAVFGAQEAVYADTGWTGVRDQVLSTPESRQTVEQTVVLYPSRDEAHRFFDSARQSWQECAGRTISIGTGDAATHWDIADVVAEESLFTQFSTEQQQAEWPCDHALAVASNVVFETWACGVGIGGNQAAALALHMADKAAAR
ncbi:sensor domain-containing protein [Mycobacterium sp. NPDC050441]|uniref:sensor domain-containing protein n=1 Tax=Mycobacterium sp. NPDC050441 TaxID=3155403 RepID=UPI0033CE652E